MGKNQKFELKIQVKFRQRFNYSTAKAHKVVGPKMDHRNSQTSENTKEIYQTQSLYSEYMRWDCDDDDIASNPVVLLSFEIPPFSQAEKSAVI